MSVLLVLRLLKERCFSSPQRAGGRLSLSWSTERRFVCPFILQTSDDLHCLVTEWPDCYTNLSALTNCSVAARNVLRFLVTVGTFRLSLPFLFHQSYIPTNKRREYKACGFPAQKKCRMLFHPELQNSLLCIAAIALTQFGHSLLEALAGL